MKTLIATFLLCAAAAHAQMSGPYEPKSYLVIQREFVKPGRTGSTHEKSEAAYVRAFKAAKFPTPYIGMESNSGPSRVLFLSSYDSLQAWADDDAFISSKPALAAAVDRANLTDGDLQTSYDQGVWHLRTELSSGGYTPTLTLRYFEITQFHVKPGHEAEFEELVKMYKDAYAKETPHLAWTVWDNVYGKDDGGVYLAIFGRKSLSEVDAQFGQDKHVMEAMGAAGQKKLAELSAACLESVQSNLFKFNPRMSYLVGDISSMDPSGFWTPKPAAVQPVPKPQ